MHFWSGSFSPLLAHFLKCAWTILDRMTDKLLYVYIAPLVIKFTSLRLVVRSWSKTCLLSFAKSALSISTQDVNQRVVKLNSLKSVKPVCHGYAPTEPQKTDPGSFSDSIWHLSQRCTHRRQTPPVEVWLTVCGACLRDTPREDRHLRTFSRQYMALVSETCPWKTDTCGCLADGMWHLSQRCTHRRQTPVDV